jgi:hypothetical protein
MIFLNLKKPTIKKIKISFQKSLHEILIKLRVRVKKDLKSQLTEKLSSNIMVMILFLQAKKKKQLRCSYLMLIDYMVIDII